MDFSLVNLDFPEYWNDPTWVYILALHNDTFYVGISREVGKRFTSHCQGRGARATQRSHPVKMLVRWQCTTRVEARMWEDYFIAELRTRKVSAFSIPEIRELYRAVVTEVGHQVARDCAYQLSGRRWWA